MSWEIITVVICTIVAICSLLDWTTTEEEKTSAQESLIGWWCALGDFSFGEAIQQASRGFICAFDSVYGVKDASKSFFLRSLLSSFIAVVFCFFIYTLTRDFPLFIPTMGDAKMRSEAVMPFLFLYTLAVLIFNGFGDMLSLIETRAILKICSGKRLSLLAWALLADILLSALIFAVMPSLMLLSAYVAREFDVNPISSVSVDIEFGDVLDFIWQPITLICFLSTFFTSVVLYAYFVCVVAFKAFKLSRTRIMTVLERVAGSGSPYKALGTFLSVLFGALAACVKLVCCLSCT